MAPSAGGAIRMLERVFWLPRRFPRWDGHRASPEVVGRSLGDSKLPEGDRLTRWVICLKMLIGPFGAVEQELSNRSRRTRDAGRNPQEWWTAWRGADCHQVQTVAKA